jgi:hypothetical protein
MDSIDRLARGIPHFVMMSDFVAAVLFWRHTTTRSVKTSLLGGVLLRDYSFFYDSLITPFVFMLDIVSVYSV